VAVPPPPLVEVEVVVIERYYDDDVGGVGCRWGDHRGEGVVPVLSMPHAAAAAAAAATRVVVYRRFASVNSDT